MLEPTKANRQNRSLRESRLQHHGPTFDEVGMRENLMRTQSSAVRVGHGSSSHEFEL